MDDICYDQQPYSPAGTWGVQRKKAAASAFNGDFRTTYRSNFDDSRIKNAKDSEKQPHLKFKRLKENNHMILPYSEKDFDAMLSSSDNIEEPPTGEKRFETTSRSMNEWLSVQTSSPVNLLRTQSKSLRLADAPIAIGRSGLRVERGPGTSGLSGERLNLAKDPSRNSFAQRSWMYQDDPALYYKTNGTPAASFPDDVSLNIGDSSAEARTARIHSNHGRKAVLTGNVLTRSGSSKNGVFLDDENVS